MNNCNIAVAKNYNHLSMEEREEIAVGLEKGENPSQIARRLKRSRSTIYREIKRNRPQKYSVCYRANRAQLRSVERSRTSHARERLKNSELRNYVEGKLREGWTPEIIAGRLKLERKQEQTNYESIYQWIYYERFDLIQYLPKSHRKRRKRGSACNKRIIRISNRVLIDQRPPEVATRQEAGHWEADTIVSRQSKAAIAVVQERVSRYCAIEHLPSKTAKSMNNALTKKLAIVPSHLLKTITYDNGTENAEHETTNTVLGIQSFFCHPYHSWEKGSVENCIGLFRRYYPKKTDFSLISQIDCDRIAYKLNTRPKKCLGFRTPEEVFVALAG